MVVVSIRTMTSVGSWIVGSGTSSHSLRPGPWYTSAFITTSSSSPGPPAGCRPLGRSTHLRRYRRTRRGRWSRRVRDRRAPTAPRPAGPPGRARPPRRGGAGARGPRRRHTDPVSLSFAASPRSSVGIEWELQLVDADSGDLRQAATSGPGPASPARTAARTRTSTPSCCSTPSRWSPASTAPSAARARTWPGPSRTCGRSPRRCASSWPAPARTPSRSPAYQRVTDKERYATLIDRTRWWGRQMLLYGVHVHVGVEDRAKVLPHHRRPAHPVRAPAVPGRLLAVLGRGGHRVRLQPGDDVPAAAHRRRAVPVLPVGATSRPTSTT